MPPPPLNIKATYEFLEKSIQKISQERNKKFRRTRTR